MGGGDRGGGGRRDRPAKEAHIGLGIMDTRVRTAQRTLSLCTSVRFFLGNLRGFPFGSPPLKSARKGHLGWDWGGEKTL